MSNYVNRTKGLKKEVPSLDPITKIKVIGVGGGGCNAVERMKSDGVRGIEFIVANTDYQQLQRSECKKKIILGKETYKGLGAGKDPEVGKLATIESSNEIKEALADSDMVFITAGLGGGTGTGGAPEVAKIAKDLGILTIGVVTLPFKFEGKIKSEFALTGLEEMQKYTDGILLIKNEGIIETIGNAPLQTCFAEVDNVLRTFVQATSDIVTKPGQINVDFADIRATLANSGMILCGVAKEVINTKDDIELLTAKTIENPLIISDVKGARSVLLNITSGPKLAFNAITEIANSVSEDISGGKKDELNFKWGQFVNNSLKDNEVILTLIASNFRNEIELDDEGHTISAHYEESEDSKDYDDSDVVIDDTYESSYAKQQYTTEDIFGKVPQKTKVTEQTRRRTKKRFRNPFKK